MVGNYLDQLNSAYESQTKLMEQSDGSSLHRPSDNPVNYSKYLRYQNSLSENTQYQSNVATAVSWMKKTDSSMVDMTNCMTTIVAKANAGANTTNNDSDMTAIAQEMMAQIQELVSDANAQQGDSYIFAGQSDLVQPFALSEGQVDRGLTKTLDDSQKSFFNDTDSSGELSQMLQLSGTAEDGTTSTYYLNTLTGDVYTQDFMESGYKDKLSAGQKTVDPEADRAGTIGGALSVSENFKNTGEIKDTGRSWTKDITVGGQTVKLSFATQKQQIVSYSGDDKYISMVKQNGATKPDSDTVNVTGQDLCGRNIFDDTNSGNKASGTASFNDLLMVQAKTASADNKWLSTDGITIANAANNTVVNAEAKLASRQQVYTDVTSMLATQNTAITADVTTVSGTDVAKLAVQLMEAQTIYNMSLSVGGKILPSSLADYLS